MFYLYNAPITDQMKNALSLICMLLAGILMPTTSFAQSNTLFNPDYNGDGFIGVDDILGALSFYDTAWDGPVANVILGCTYPAAVEYNSSANVDDGSCTFLPDCAGVINGTTVVDACGVCGGSGIPEGDCDCDGNVLDECGTCGGSGIPEGDCDCDGNVLDECGLCNGPGAIYDCGCSGIPVGDCDCDGNQLDALGVCGGSCSADADGDGICDDVDPAQFQCGNPISYQGYDYSTVLIGDQCWFSENCRYLPEVSPSSAGSETSPYYYVYGYEGSTVSEAKATSNYATYGVLYNWPAVMTEGICPSGWHIPSDEEFTQLIDFLGGEGVAGGKMKDDVQWNGYNTSGWSGLPGGYRYSGGFSSYVYYGYWWSAAEGFGSTSWRRTLSHYHPAVSRGNVIRYNGFSARCVRDAE